MVFKLSRSNIVLKKFYDSLGYSCGGVEPVCLIHREGALHLLILIFVSYSDFFVPKIHVLFVVVGRVLVIGKDHS